MLRHVIAFSVNRAGLVVACAALIIVWAGVRLGTMPVDVFPELNAPTVVILTEAGGLSSEEVEQRVSFPIESAMTGLAGVRRVRSASALSLSLVWVEFGWGEDIYRARQLVSEKLASVEERLPAETHAELSPMTSITGEIMLISLSSPGGQADDMALRSHAEFVVRPRLLAVAGVSQVVAIGGQLPEYQVHADPDELLGEGLALVDLVAATSESHSTASAGYLPNEAGREQPIQQQSAIRSTRDLAEALVTTRKGAPLPIGAVATVGLGGAPRRGTAADGGRSAVVLSIQKAPRTNTLELTRAVDEALDDVEAGLPAGMTLNRHAFRQSNFIGRSVDNVTTVLRDAVIIVSVILLLFLMHIRSTLITLTALPLSLGVSLLVLDAVGLTINVMTLGGLAVAIGELVDDAIIDVENVLRRLRENAARPVEERLAVIRVVFDASNEIRRSVVFATVIICAVFIPLLFLEGLEGRFFRPLGLAYIVAILASLVVALTVTPALCTLLLRRGKLAQEREGFLVRGMKAVYGPILGLALAWRKTVLAAALLATAGAIWVSTHFETSFLPEFNEGSMTIFIVAPPGTSLEESDRLAGGIERRIASLEAIESVVRRTGRAERDEHAEPVWSSEIDVTLAPGATMREARALVDGILVDVKGVDTLIGQPIEHRLSHILSGTPAAIAISFYGEDLSTLRRVAKRAEAALKSVPGARDVAASREALVPTLPIRYRRDDLARAGLSPASAARQVSAGFSGAVVNEVRDGSAVYDLVVRLRPERRRTRKDIEDFVLRGRDGQLVRLRDVATVAPGQASVVVTRENARRKAVVSCNVADGYNLGGVVASVKKVIDPLAREADVSVSYGGQFQAEQAARRTLMTWGGVVCVLVLMLLIAALGSVRAALLVMINLPLGLIGGIAAVYLTRADAAAPVVSVAGLVGFITLFGIAIRNGILLVNHYRTLQQDEGLPLDEAIRRGSMERLSPILMTALTAVLGLIPLAMAAGQPGSELLAPLAVVVLGGLTTSTFLNLIVVPAAYRVVFARAARTTPRTVDRLVLTRNKARRWTL